MTHKTWPPPVGTLLILTDVETACINGGWQNGDVLQVVEEKGSPPVDVIRLRDSGGSGTYRMRPEWCRPLEETDNDQT